MSSPERIVIDIKFKYFEKLIQKRNEALERNLLFADSEDYVPAVIEHGGKKMDAKVRLKGDNLDHLMGDKWSYRIKISGNDTLMGMKVLSIQQAGARNYIYEWIYHEAMKREGVVAPRFMFVQVTLNGKNLGIYSLEEHFDKRLLENNQRREGPLLKFSEDLFWEVGLNTPLYGDPMGTGAVETFQTAKTLESPVLTEQFRVAVSMLEDFRNGRLPTSKVFDMEKLAKYMAVSDIMGGQHGLGIVNQRFYYNPVTSRLEPVSYDAAAGRDTVPAYVRLSGKYLPYFEDEEFFEIYLRELSRVVADGWLESFLADIGPELQSNLDIIYMDYPWETFSDDVFMRNRDLLRRAIYPEKKVFNVYMKDASGDAIELKMANISRLPVKIESIAAGGMVFYPVEDMLLDAMGLRQLKAEYRDMRFAVAGGAVPDAAALAGAVVRFGIPGTGFEGETPVYPLPYREDSFAAVNSALKDARGLDLPFVRVDDEAATIELLPGDWTLDQVLNIPSGYTVRAGAGFALDVVAGGMLVSYSPVVFAGTEDIPVKIYSSDGAGMGMLVLDAGAGSTLDRVVFDNLINPSMEGWAMTGQ